jgi:hypothetical protein
MRTSPAFCSLPCATWRKRKASPKSPRLLESSERVFTGRCRCAGIPVYPPIENVAAGIFQIAFQLSREAVAVKQVLRKYRDRQIDLADACLIRLADEFGIGDILTLDQDFAIYRWGKNKAFRMLPSKV